MEVVAVQFEMNNQTNKVEPLTDTDVTVDLVKSEHERAIQSSTTGMTTIRDRMKAELIKSGEAKALSDSMSLSNPQTIVEFGKQISEDMSRCADEILRRQDISTLSQTSNMMAILTKIMDKVDIKELEAPAKEPGIFTRMFSSAQKRIEQLISKYNSIGSEIEKVCTELKTYEIEIEQSNRDLDGLYENGINNYRVLCKYTVAGELAIDEMAKYIANLEVEAQNNPDAAMRLNNAKQTEQLLQQRVQDLRMAEAVALQSLPIIKAMQFGNYNLARKINSSFIVTIPVFKNAMAQAIIAKKQRMQADALKALDDKTNEMLIRNAQMAADNMRMTAQLSGSSAIKAETIQQSWQAIMDGIRDTKNIQEELAKQRQRDKAAIEDLNNKYLSQYTIG